MLGGRSRKQLGDSHKDCRLGLSFHWGLSSKEVIESQLAFSESLMVTDITEDGHSGEPGRGRP